ncbi:MAG: sulfatase-like hydrolase/transferase [Sphaerochaeta sp.]|nr:sulfatase-like hydrolase/transferase [Sphaerochaeta sp.]
MAQPNIIFYFSDQQRFDTCGCYGQSLDITPRLDAMAEEGVRFDLAFSPQPVCGPCRSLFQTGLYPTETGCFRNNIALPSDVKTLANYLTEAGYENAYIGKWHLASTGGLEETPTVDYHTKPIPVELRGGYEGFWRASDVLEFTSDGYGGYVYDENNAKCEFSGYRANCITDFALEFLDQYNGEKPFFMTVSHIEPHHQNDANHYQGPPGSQEKFKEFPVPGDLLALGGDYKEEYPDYLGACESVDENLGRLVASLKQKGLYDNTVIIFSSDHGSHFRTRNQDGHLNGYDDYKRTCHDAALRIPLVIRGGAFLGGKVVHELVSTASLPKTILAMAGVDVGSAMIGEDLADVVDTTNPDRVNEIFAQISESRVGRCIRTPRFKYAVYAPGKNGGTDMDSDVYVDDFLYDLDNDPFELTNLIHDKAYDRDKLVLRERLTALIAQAEHKGVRIEDDASGKSDH